MRLPSDSPLRFRLPNGRLLLACVLGCSLPALSGCGSGIQGGALQGNSVAAVAVSKGPQLGYVWSDADATLRPILGIPGSAQFGQSITSSGTYKSGSAEGSSSFAVLVGANQSIVRVSLPDGTPTTLPGQAASGSQVRLSPLGGAAFLFVPGASSGVVLTQLSGSAQSRSITAAGPIVDAAVSEAGTVAIATKSSNGVVVQVSPAFGKLLTAQSLTGSGGIAFVGSTEDLLVADSGANTLSRIRSASTTPSPSVVPTSGLLKGPLSVAASRAGRWAVIANGGDQSVVRVDLSGSVAAQRASCNCQPSLASPLSVDGTFRLTSVKDGPVWIADANNASFPILFIPALQSGSKAAQR